QNRLQRRTKKSKLLPKLSAKMVSNSLTLSARLSILGGLSNETGQVFHRIVDRMLPANESIGVAYVDILLVREPDVQTLTVVFHHAGNPPAIIWLTKYVDAGVTPQTLHGYRRFRDRVLPSAILGRRVKILDDPIDTLILQDLTHSVNLASLYYTKHPQNLSLGVFKDQVQHLLL
ncbi:hypothetical protein AAKU55_005781, partial [Oxalobacteraceae bacterium GrIS 1.11]